MNKIGILFFALSTMGIGTLSAQTADSTQTSPWTKEGFAGLKLTQVSLTNWAAGGDNSVAFDLPVHLRHSKLNSLRGMTIRSTKMFQSPNLWLPVI